MFELVVGRRRRPSPLTFFVGALGGAIVTAAGVALSNPQRRTRARNRVKASAARTVDLLDKARRDAMNRAVGAAAAAAGTMRHDDASEQKLVARVRTTLGRVSSHPHAIHVRASDGRVTLSGAILRPELDGLLRAVRRVRGVHDVESQLDVHERDDATPSLQGRSRVVHVSKLRREHWTPSLRVVAGVLGIAALASGATHPRSTARIGLAAVGALLLARAGLDHPLARILGIGSMRRSVELHKTIAIRAPVDEVFACWVDFERFPQFMEHVENVKVMTERRSHWSARGPLGSIVEWDAEITTFEPNERIGWKSVDGSLIKNAGIVRFESIDDGRATRLDVRLSYNPIIGYVGHGIAALFGVDPKKALDEDLLRLKSLLEDGKTRAHGREVTRDTRRLWDNEGRTAASHP